MLGLHLPSEGHKELPNAASVSRPNLNFHLLPLFWLFRDGAMWQIHPCVRLHPLACNSPVSACDAFGLPQAARARSSFQLPSASAEMAPSLWNGSRFLFCWGRNSKSISATNSLRLSTEKICKKADLTLTCRQFPSGLRRDVEASVQDVVSCAFPELMSAQLYHGNPSSKPITWSSQRIPPHTGRPTGSGEGHETARLVRYECISCF